MKITIDVQGLAEVKAALSGLSDRRMRAAMATALTRTAVAVRTEMQADMLSALDRPTPYTQRRLRYVGATAERLVAGVGFDIEAITDISGNVVRYSDQGPGSTPAGKYIQFQAKGGTRAMKRFELALQAKGSMPRGWVSVPAAGARLDAFGNMSRGQIAQIIAQLGTELMSGYANTIKQTGKAGTRARIAQQRRAGGQYIAVQPGSKIRLKPGIYQREFIGRNLTPVLMFVRGATYTARWDFEGRASAAASRIIGGEVDRALGESVARMAARGRA
jgi:hypothetical protein